MKKHGPIMNFSKITDNIYVGTNACCQIHFDNKLLKKGVKANVGMEAERIDQPIGIKSSLWLPTKDITAPTGKQLDIGVSFIDTVIKNKEKVYIHCRNGHGRAPTMTAAYFISQGMTVPSAISKIKKKRPEIHLDKKQVDALKRFAKKYK
jgi:protein-tyrosine phosphatase